MAVARLNTPARVPSRHAADMFIPKLTAARRAWLEDWVEQALALLDAIDGDPDIEDADPAEDAERCQRVVPTRDVEGMRRSGAQRSQTQRIEGHVDGD